MSNHDFPTPADVGFFKEHQAFFRERWIERGPRFGDWVLDDGNPGIAIYIEEDEISVEHQDYEYGWCWCRKDDLIPLFRPDQLIGMLEERGYRGALWFDIATQTNYGEAGLYSVQAFHKDRTIHYPLREGEAVFEILTVGPTPAIALGKALMGVWKEERDGLDS